MTVTAPVRPARKRHGDGGPPEGRVEIEVLVCGSLERGDDAAGRAAVDQLAGRLPDGVALRRVGQLEVDHLLQVPRDAGLVVVDTATGLDPGWIVRLPLRSLIGRSGGLSPRSARCLAIPEVLGLVEMIRGRPIHGVIVAIGGLEFGPGGTLSWPVQSALGSLASAIEDAVAHVRAEIAGQGQAPSAGPVDGLPGASPARPRGPGAALPEPPDAPGRTARGDRDARP